jgi:hypothetical protein
MTTRGSRPQDTRTEESIDLLAECKHLVLIREKRPHFGLKLTDT